MTREWLWCAITRARDFNKVYFFQNEKADEEMFKNLVLNYFKGKCEQYKLQDKAKNRDVDEENYVDVEWVLKHFKGRCCNSGVKFYLDIKAGKLTTNFTAQRKDNELGHSVDNCEPWCYQCNCSAH